MSQRHNLSIRRFTRVTIIIILLIIVTFFLRWANSQSSAKAAAVLNNSVPVASVSAASFIGSPASLAPNSIIAGFGTQLATGTQAATMQPLPTSLLNTSVTVNGTAAQ